ncbi:MAG: phage major capsid protein [Ruminococcus sp.]|nr:phage major capsid protein [Ruminococcus sp.]
MKNKDVIEQKRADFRNNLKQAFDAQDMGKVADAFGDFAAGLQSDIAATAEEYARTNDSAVLSARGIRQLTSAEQKFYNDFAAAAKSTDPKQALTGIESTFPTTIIDTVMDDIEASHPLLAEIDFRNTTGITRWIYSDGSVQLASWGKLTDTIIKEISSSIEDIDFKLSKLTAFIPIPIDLLDLGASYIDAYVRVMLNEALSFGMELGVLKGTGKNQPIGMVKDLTAGNIGTGEYDDKTAIELTSLSIFEYCAIVGLLSKRPNGTSRVVPEVLLVVNPTDYITKIIPATTVLATDGTYKGNIFPYPTKVIQSEVLDEGEAVIGIAKQYKGFLAGSELDYSDEYQWLEENRVYKAKTRAYGTPADNTSFFKLDISGLKPRTLEVKVVDTAASSNDEESGNTTGGNEESGNATSNSEETTPTYTAVEEPTGNPSELGYYELVNGEYELSEDTSVDSEKTYYTLDE